MIKNLLINAFVLSSLMTNVLAADLYNISLADDNTVLLNSNSSRIIDGKRVRIDHKLSMQKQIFQMMPRDLQKDNIYEGLSTDLYNLNIRF